MNPRSRTSRAAGALTALAAAATAALSLTAGPALADNCPNAALRAQNNSEQLPDCRAYEQVSPTFKEGFNPTPYAITDDAKMVYWANGNFADNEFGSAALAGGNTYVTERTPGGWTVKALAPPATIYNTSGALALAFTPDLRSSLWGMNRVEQPVGTADLYVRRPDDTFTRLGPTANPDSLPPTAPGGSAISEARGQSQIGASGDLSHVIVSVTGPQAYPGIVPDASSNLYELVEGNATPRAVGLNNAGQQIAPGCESSVGDRAQSTYRAMSTDGRVIFWTSFCFPKQLWARINGTTTIAVSGSQCTRGPSDPGGSCDGLSSSTFEGANAHGTRVYFTTSQQLINADVDESNDLYECDVPAGTPAPVGLVNQCPDLRRVSGAAGDADVQHVVRVSDDGSRVYFVATGVLAANHGANDEPASNGDLNLYVWQRDAGHPAGETAFVGKLDPADTPLWNFESSNARIAQTTDDGQYLLFATFAPLIDQGPQADTDTSQDVYRYDADSGNLTRLSTGTDGEGGNSPGLDAVFSSINYDLVRPTDGPRRAITEDGATAVFLTSEALSPADTNGGPDMYMWRDGHVWLLSNGRPSGDGLLTVGRLGAWISPSGRDIYLLTSAPLLSSDVDTVADIYDARVDGGFDLSTPPPCVGDGCQGGRSAPPPASQPASTGPGGSPQAAPSFSVKALTASQRKRVASTGKVMLSVSTNVPGTLSTTATATIAKRVSTVGSAKRTVATAGTWPLSLTLSKRARAELRSKHMLTVKVLVSQGNVAVSRTVSLKLTQPAAKGRRS